jgi:hypothetical protein
MRTIIENREVTTANIGETSNFRIKANGKAFKVLIDGLYSDKIRAVIREIWSNAFDAHAMAGCTDKPFDCHLPSPYEPTFRVRDYGVGMDHDTIMHLYTTVFESSKEDTNEQVGKLGLGSKSPFAYTDTFSITAWSGTEKRVYTAFIGSNYVPQIALIATQASKEPRGIEVQFAVKVDDCQAFLSAARATVRGFDVMPRITGQPLNITPFETVMSGNGWRLVNGGTYGTKAHAKQGCVIYPLDPYALDKITEFERAILTSPFFIDFAIGDLEISASRESLGYDEPTKANIRRRVEEIANEIVTLYQSEIDACPSMWMACLKFKKLTKSQLDKAVVEVLKAKITYKGKQLRPKIDLGGFLRPEFDKLLGQGGLRAMSLPANDLEKGRHYGRRTRLKFEPSTYIQVAAGETVVLFEDADKPIGNAQGRIRYWWDNLQGERPVAVLWVKAKRDAMSLKRLLIILGRPDTVIDMATLEKPPVDKAAYQKRQTKVKVLDRGWLETEIDEDDDIIYVQLNKRTTTGPGGLDSEVSVSAVTEAVSLLVKLGYLDATKKIHGIPQTHKNKIAANDHWVNFWDLARKAIAEKYDEKKAVTARSYDRKVSSWERMDKFFVGLVAWNGFTGFRASDSPAVKLYDRWVDIVAKAKASEELETATKLNFLLTGDFPTVTEIDLSDLEKAFNVAYPMAMPVIKDGVNPEMRQHLIDYVNLVDVSTEFVQSQVNENDLKAA